MANPNYIILSRLSTEYVMKALEYLCRWELKCVNEAFE